MGKYGFVLVIAVAVVGAVAFLLAQKTEQAKEAKRKLKVYQDNVAAVRHFEMYGGGF
jgi:ABC-type transporter Mla subunit MlaD